MHEPEPPVETSGEEDRDAEDSCRPRIVGADGRRKAPIAPPMKKAAATTQPAMIQRCVGWSIIGRPCQSSSMIMVGTEIATTRSVTRRGRPSRAIAAPACGSTLDRPRPGSVAADIWTRLGTAPNGPARSIRPRCRLGDVASAVTVGGESQPIRRSERTDANRCIFCGGEKVGRSGMTFELDWAQQDMTERVAFVRGPDAAGR